ncbi:Replication factor C subunit 3 [Operophtera brumata]|uniref:Replication factor C subunit 3 n=1 Tax=Operophtera brumata TaxID=104452 RepID=A0A0L7LPE0_OPEBR|nr:Replication factor C subunit 3 [Operophtera brumata]
MTVGEASINLPWVEKYRPSKLEDLVSHDDIVKTINQFMKGNQLPHLLFYGPPGTGKTTTILACARQMYTPQQFNSMVLELNASDDRGIGIVRGQILSFASTRTIFKAGPKLIILDEADAMTNDAQNALRRNSEDEEVQSKPVKITVVGEPSTGKSSLCSRYLGGSGVAAGSTQGAEVMAGQCIGLRLPVPLQLCDVAGNALDTHMLGNYLYASDKPLAAGDGQCIGLRLPVPLQLCDVAGNALDTHMLGNYLYASDPLAAGDGQCIGLRLPVPLQLCDVAGNALDTHMLGNYLYASDVNIAFSSVVARALGLKIRKLPEITMNGKSPLPKDPDRNRLSATQQDSTHSLIMNRKALRKIQRKASSTVCAVQ